MLRPLDRPSCVNIKPSGVAHASARKGGNGGDYDDRSDYKQPSPKEESGNLMSFTVILIKKVVKLAGVLLVLATIFAAAAPSMFSSPRGLKTIMSMASHTIPGEYLQDAGHRLFLFLENFIWAPWWFYVEYRLVTVNCFSSSLSSTCLFHPLVTTSRMNL